jgi:predicted ribonuclease YlaK
MSNKFGDVRWKWLDERGYRVLNDRHQYAYMQSLWSPNDVVQGVFCDSRAGTGKTTLAVLAGVYEVDRGNYDKIIYVRNAVAIRDIGFLPGDDKEKMAPYYAPLEQAMDNAQPGLYKKWSQADPLTKQQPKVFALSSTFARGVTWNNAYIILDEAQNFDLDELQAAYTRITDSCKIVTIGSTRQVDNKKLRRYDGLTPFEVYMKHFEGTRVTYHKLETNYRGWFSNHADDVIDTVTALEGQSKTKSNGGYANGLLR